MAGGNFQYGDLKNNLEKDHISQVYSFFGDELFLRRRALDMLRKKVCHEETDVFSYSVVYLEETPLSEFLNHARSIPMFGSQRLMILKVKGTEKAAEAELNSLEAYLQHPSPKTVMVLEFDPDYNRYDKKNKESRLFKLVDRYTDKYNFQRLKEENLVKFLHTLSQEKGFHISSDSIAFLVKRLGDDMELSVRELEKLFLLMDAGSSIRREDLEQVVAHHPISTIFDIQEALARRDAKLALDRLGFLMEMGEHHLGMLVMIGRFFHQLLFYKSLVQKKITEQEIRNRMKLIQPQFVNLQMANCNYSQAEVRYCLALVGQAEEQFKSIHTKPSTHMELLLVRLTRTGQTGKTKLPV